jgi:hypothetical protein
MGVLDFFKTTAETSEHAINPVLRSKYYKAKYSKVKDVCLAYAKERKLDVENVDDEHHELFIKHRKFHIIVTILQLKGFKTSVDIKVQKYSFIGLNKPYKEIVQLYRYLDTNLTKVMQ